MIRKLLKKLILWALDEQPNVRIDVAVDPLLPENILIAGASTKKGRSAIINAVRLAKTTREL